MSFVALKKFSAKKKILQIKIIFKKHVISAFVFIKLQEVLISILEKVSVNNFRYKSLKIRAFYHF